MTAKFNDQDIKRGHIELGDGFKAGSVTINRSHPGFDGEPGKWSIGWNTKCHMTAEQALDFAKNLMAAVEFVQDTQ